MIAPRFPFSLSVVIPVFNDAAVLPELNRRLQAVLPGLSAHVEVLFIDDGSRDASLATLLELQSQYANIKIIQLNRNFGQPNALAAGLDQAKGDILVLMDSDLQDRPEDLEQLLATQQQGQVPMVIACWSDRQEAFTKRIISQLFNRFANRISEIKYPPHARVFRVLTKEIVQAWKSFPSSTTTPLSLISWMGYDYATLPLTREARAAGSSGYTLRSRINLSLERILSSSLFPLRLAGYLGVALILISLSLSAYGLIRELWASPFFSPWIIVSLLETFLSGIILLALGILGAYLGRIYLEMRQRPRYIIKKIYQKESHD